jgi:micrococcal nuclease
MDKLKLFTYKAKLVKVIDGDTLDVLVDLGFDIWAKKRIRLFGIDAPEIRTKDLIEKEKGLIVKNRLIEILNKSNDEFFVVSHGIGKYGRCLGELFIEEKSVNKQLISEGLAKVYNK